jgi:hypothetical protein
MRTVVFGTSGLPLIRNHTEKLSLEEIERPVIGVAEPSACFDDLIQDWLQPARARDGPENTADRALLFT